MSRGGIAGAWSRLTGLFSFLFWRSFWFLQWAIEIKSRRASVFEVGQKTGIDK
jgi:hypothetical protein